VYHFPHDVVLLSVRSL